MSYNYLVVSKRYAIINDLNLELLLKPSDDEKQKLILTLSKSISKSIVNNTFHELSKNNSNCPHCHSSNIIKRGTYKGNQKFFCKDCNKRFTLKTNSIFSHTLKSLDTWYKNIQI